MGDRGFSGFVAGGRMCHLGLCHWWVPDHEAGIGVECRVLVSDHRTCLGCCWTVWWWCLIAEWGGRCRRGVLGCLIGGGRNVACCRLICDCVGWECLLVEVDCGCDWKVSLSRMLYQRMSLGGAWCCKVAWRVSGGVWIRVLLMMREWYVAGRCCAGRWLVLCYGVDFFGVMGFTHPQPNVCKFNQTAEISHTI